MQYNITYREKDKGIQIIISYKDKAGIWKQKSKQGFKTKKEAKRAADLLLDELKKTIKIYNNIPLGMENFTIGELKEAFLDHTKTHRALNTYIHYEQSLRSFPLDEIEVSNLKLADVQKCINSLVGKIAVTTLHTKVIVFKSMLNFAYKQYNIPVISLSNLVIPKNTRVKKNRALNDADTKKLLESFKINHSCYYIICLLAATCGLRVGEILGLTWDNVNLETMQLTVCQQWKRKKDNSFGFGELKSKNSNRIIPIPNTTVAELKAFYETEGENADNRLLKYYNAHALVNNLDVVLKDEFNISIHGLRHTYATRLVKSGLDFKTIAKILGHEVEMTMKTYSHVTDEMFERASNVIQDIF